MASAAGRFRSPASTLSAVLLNNGADDARFPVVDLRSFLACSNFATPPALFAGDCRRFGHAPPAVLCRRREVRLLLPGYGFDNISGCGPHARSSPPPCVRFSLGVAHLCAAQRGLCASCPRLSPRVFGPHVRSASPHVRSVGPHVRSVGPHVRSAAPHGRSARASALAFATTVRSSAAHGDAAAAHGRGASEHAVWTATHLGSPRAHVASRCTHSSSRGTHLHSLGTHSPSVSTHSRQVVRHHKTVPTHALPGTVHGRALATHDREVAAHPLVSGAHARHAEAHLAAGESHSASGGLQLQRRSRHPVRNNGRCRSRTPTVGEQQERMPQRQSGSILCTSDSPTIDFTSSLERPRPPGRLVHRHQRRHRSRVRLRELILRLQKRALRVEYLQEIR